MSVTPTAAFDDHWCSPFYRPPLFHDDPSGPTQQHAVKGFEDAFEPRIPGSLLERYHEQSAKLYFSYSGPYSKLFQLILGLHRTPI